MCLTCQDQFVELGGVRTMCALLHSKESRVVNEAVTALSYIVSDSEANRQVVIGENGLEQILYLLQYMLWWVELCFM